MEILYVFGSFGGGGTEHHFYNLIKHRNQPGWNPSLFILSNDDNFIEQFGSLGIQIYFIPKLKKNSFPGLHLIKSISYLFQIINKNNYDIVHTYFFLGHVFGTLGALIFRVSKVFSNREDSGFLLKPWHFRVLHIINKYVDKIIPIAHFVSDIRRKLEKFPSHQQLVIHNGITLDMKFTESSTKIRESLSLSDSEYLVTVVANMNYEIKGHRYLLQAIDILRNKNINARFLLVGDGILKQELIDQAKKMGIYENVLFLGYRNDVPAILAVSDLFVLPSLSEGLSISILEAMRAHLPVVATEVGGNPEIVTNGENGLLVPTQDASSLANAIERLYIDRSYARRLVDNAYAVVCEKFSLDKVTQRYWDLYNS